MKQLFLAIVFTILLGATLSAQKNIYESAKFDEFSAEHEVLAILPFLTNLDLKDEISKEELKTLEEKEGRAVQNALEIYFSKRKKKKSSL
ncbi:hypothetical protein [Maribacter halichondriae]|uniref:hypothetical protein n=1 Tax=Maribacter halichondriae TaxID=2980554 RepID=UPI00307684B2